MSSRVVVLVCAMAVYLAVTLAPGLGAQDASNHAGIIVTSGEREVARMCIAFDTDEITGSELLDRSGLDVVGETGAIGTSVCSIEGTGCGRGDCFCSYPTFWGYWTQDTGTDEWRFSDSGAADRIVRDGSLDAWSWGRDGKPAPQDISFADVCSASAETARPESTRPTSAPPNYLAFAGFVALLGSAAALAYVLRRRRS